MSAVVRLAVRLAGRLLLALGGGPLRGELDVAHAKQTISVDGWIEFGAPPRVAVLFRQLRAELDRLLLQKIKEPKLELERTGRTVSAIVQPRHEEAAAKP